MTDELNQEQETGMEQDYLAQIQEMKRNSVSRADYDRMRDENKKLLEALVEGKQLEQEVKVQEEKVPLDTLVKDFVDKPHNNLQYVEAALELRSRLMEEGHDDPFVAKGHKLVPDPSDYEKAAVVAEAFQHCVDYAEGDSEAFTNELMRITRDIPIPTKRRR